MREILGAVSVILIFFIFSMKAKTNEKINELTNENHSLEQELIETKKELERFKYLAGKLNLRFTIEKSAPTVRKDVEELIELIGE